MLYFRIRRTGNNDNWCLPEVLGNDARRGPRQFYVSLEQAVGIVAKILLDSYGLNSRRLKGRQRGHLFFLRAGYLPPDEEAIAPSPLYGLT